MRIRAKRLRRAALAAGAVAAAGLVGCQSTGTHFAQGGVARGETYANSAAVAQRQSGQQMMVTPGMPSGQMTMTAGQPGMMMPGQPLPANQAMMLSGPPMVGSGGTVYPVNYTPAAGPQIMQVTPTNFTPSAMPGAAMAQTQQQVTATLPVTPGAIGQPTIMLVNGPNGPQYVITEMVSQSPAPTGAQMMSAPMMPASATFTPAMPAPPMAATNYTPAMPAPVTPAPIMPTSTPPVPVVSAPVMLPPATPSPVPAPITPVLTPTGFSDVAPAPLPAPVPTPIALPAPSPAPVPMPPPTIPAPAPIPTPAPTYTPPAPINVPTPPTPVVPTPNEVSFKAPAALPPAASYKSPTGSVVQASDTSSALSSLPAPALGPIVPAKLPPATGTSPDDEISSAPVFVPAVR